MKIIEKQLNKYINNLNNDDIEIVKYLNIYEKKIPTMKIKELAPLCFTSISTLHRIVKKLGFEGFVDLKYRIMTESEKSLINTFDSEEYYKKSLNHIELTKRLNEKEFSKVSNAIISSNKCYCFGTGWKQNQYVNNFSNDLLHYGKNMTMLRTINDLKLVSNNADNNTLILIVSLNGDGDNYVEIIKSYSLKKSTIISVTIDSSNKLASLADYSLYYKCDSLNDENHWNSITLNFLLEYLLDVIIKEIRTSNNSSE